MKPDWLVRAESISLADYTYTLPDERIASYPVSPRDSSKLLVYQEGSMYHQRFYELPEHLEEGTLLVANDTKVIPARVVFYKPTGARIELLLLHPEQPTRTVQEAMLVQGSCTWACMVGNKKRWKPYETLSTTLTLDEQSVTIDASYASYDENLIRLDWSADVPFLMIIEALGRIPLPPYIQRDTEAADSQTYQTVYAQHEGAVAAPTAGLHFTDEVLGALAEKGVERGEVTLHVGAGTFLPMKSDTVAAHPMHAEQVVYSKALLEQLLRHPEGVVAIGTTSMRSLESLYWFGVKYIRGEEQPFWLEKLYPYPLLSQQLPSITEVLEALLNYMEANALSILHAETEIFIFPGYSFRLCRGLITNFHQPNSTLILLVAAFVGEAWRMIYEQAFVHDYRFLSYGDSSLLWRVDG